MPYPKQNVKRGQFIQMYEQGIHYLEIAKRLDVAPSNIFKWRKEYNLPSRGRGGDHRSAEFNAGKAAMLAQAASNE
jgi:transposase-like protein